MTLCERSYSSQLAFSFLYEVKKEFLQLYGNDIDKTERPFAFNKFGMLMKLFDLSVYR